MNHNRIYIEELGYRDPIRDHEELAWFFEQKVKGRNKAYTTRYWLNLKESIGKKLYELQAWELYGFLCEKCTTEQEKRRERAREQARIKAQIEMENFENWRKEWIVKRNLLAYSALNMN